MGDTIVARGCRMRMYPTLDAWLTTLVVVGVSVFVTMTLCALVAAGLSLWEGRTCRGRESRHILSTSRRFADLVAVGDFEAADAAIGEASRSRVIGWDERAILDLSLEKARRELTETAPTATWFPDVRRTARGDVVEIVLGREEPIHLTIVSEAWAPELDGMAFEAASGAFSIMGSLSLRTMVAGVERSALRTTVEVVIHMEAIDVPEARRALTRAQTITHEGLARMAASLNPR
jgi:hypothetical protein